MAGRPKTFDRSKLLNQAMALFWRHGYQATSVRDIAKVAGLTTGTLYNEYEGKDGLFLAVLDHYLSHVITPRVEQILLSPVLPAHLSQHIQDTPKDRIEYYLVSSIHGLPEEVAFQACLLLNTEAELNLDAHEHQALANVVRPGLLSIRGGFRHLLSLAQEYNQLSRSHSLDISLGQLEVFMTGLLMSAKAKQDSTKLLPIIHHFIHTLFNEREK